MSEFPQLCVETYNDLCIKIDNLDYPVIPKGSKLTLKFNIKCLSLEFGPQYNKAYRGEIIQRIVNSIQKIYSDKKIHLKVELNITPGCVNFNFNISLKVLAIMEKWRFKAFIGTVILGIGAIFLGPLLDEAIKGRNEIAMLEAQTRHEITIENQKHQNEMAILKSRTEHELSMMREKNQYDFKIHEQEFLLQQQRQNQRKQDQETLKSLFQKNNMSFSKEDIVLIMSDYFRSSAEKHVDFIIKNPIKETFVDIPEKDIKINEMSAELELQNPTEIQETEQNAEQETEEDNSFSPSM